jgi:lipid II:glycine glycyltransferase (peptidoglycan interpeptide bridge formation enzyme)
MRPLPPDFQAECDIIDEATWCRLLQQFDDANIYQTWSYDEVRCGRTNISHLVLKRRDEVVALAQARLARIPLLKAGIAYIRWGPVCNRRSRGTDPELFRYAVRALRNEYAQRRGLVIRLYPLLFREESADLASILADEGFAPVQAKRPDRTLLLDLRRPLAELRAGLRPHWNRYLKVAEKSGLEIIEGSGDDLFASFIGMYREMVARKRFPEPNDINEFRAIQGGLPDPFKMKIMLCKAGSSLCAGLICSAIGNTGVYLFGATSDLGLKSRGSYLLHWKLIEWLKASGITYYDLHGINPETNPGTYKFKADLCGDNGKDVHFIGWYDASTNPLSRTAVALGESLRSCVRRLKHFTTPRSENAEQAQPGIAGSTS